MNYFSFLVQRHKGLKKKRERFSLPFCFMLPHTGRNLNGNLEDARVLAQIWDLYGTKLGT